jgi:hypothetical protein
MAILGSDVQRSSTIMRSSVDVCTELLHHELHHIQIAYLGRNKQGRCTIVRCLVDVCAELRHQQSHDSQVFTLGCDKQWRGSIVPYFVDICTKLLHKTLYQGQVTDLSCDTQGRCTICQPCSVDIGAKFVHQTTEIVRADLNKYGVDQKISVLYTDTLPPPSPKLSNIAAFAGVEYRIL